MARKYRRASAPITPDLEPYVSCLFTNGGQFKLTAWTEGCQFLILLRNGHELGTWEAEIYQSKSGSEPMSTKTVPGNTKTRIVVIKLSTPSCHLPPRLQTRVEQMPVEISDEHRCMANRPTDSMKAPNIFFRSSILKGRIAVEPRLCSQSKNATSRTAN